MSTIVKITNDKGNVITLHNKIFSPDSLGVLNGDETILICDMGNPLHYIWLRRDYPNLNIYGIEDYKLEPTFRYCLNELNCNIIFNKKPDDINEWIKCIKIIQNKSKNMMFDKVVGNPPFASRGNNLHLKIMKCVLDYCGGELNFIMPSKPIIEQVDEGWYNMFVDARCYKIEVVSKNCFEGTEMDDVAIYYCDKSKSLDEYSKRLDVDKVVYAAVSDEGRMLIDTMCKFQNVKVLPYTKEKAKNTDWIDKCVHYLIVSRDNGSSNGQWQSDILNKYPVMNGSEVVEKLKNRKKQSPVNLIECHNKLYGENLKTLMTEGKVLRYALWIRQSDRHMYEKVFKYVPDIAYDKLIGNTPRELDNSLLLFCGCSQDKADKILNYLDIFDFKKSRNDMVRDFDLKDLKK